MNLIVQNSEIQKTQHEHQTCPQLCMLDCFVVPTVPSGLLAMTVKDHACYAGRGDRHSSGVNDEGVSVTLCPYLTNISNITAPTLAAQAPNINAVAGPKACHKTPIIMLAGSAPIPMAKLYVP